MEQAPVMVKTPVKDQHVIKQAPVKDIPVIGRVEKPVQGHVAGGHLVE